MLDHALYYKDVLIVPSKQRHRKYILWTSEPFFKVEWKNVLDDQILEFFIYSHPIVH